MELLIFYTTASVTDQDEPNQSKSGDYFMKIKHDKQHRSVCWPAAGGHHLVLLSKLSSQDHFFTKDGTLVE
jgi:hypothetical protein